MGKHTLRPKLVDLEPWLIGHGGEGVTVSATGAPIPRREGVALGCNCPCGCDSAMCIPFANPTDGGPRIDGEQHTWQRTGDTFDVMSLAPSIKRVGGCKWHGHLVNGQFIPCDDSGN